MREIPLANGRGVALVDDEDYERVAARRWYLHEGGYAYTVLRTPGTRRKVFMHGFVIGHVAGKVIDHRNHDRLDNRRSNLRHATPQQNASNMRRWGVARYKGTFALRGGARWQARIYVEGSAIHLGTYRVQEDAARAYDAAARQHFGEFACVNFPNEGEAGALGAA